MVDSLRVKWKTAVVDPGLRSGFQRLHRGRRHQGPDVESPRGQARGLRRASRRRKGRRASRHGRSRRQGSGRARRALSTQHIRPSKGCCRSGAFRRRRRRRRTHRPGLRHRAEAARRERGADRQRAASSTRSTTIRRTWCFSPRRSCSKSATLPMTSLNEKPGRTEALKYYRRVAEHYKLNIHQYRARDFHRLGMTATFSRYNRRKCRSIARAKLCLPPATTMFPTC